MYHTCETRNPKGSSVVAALQHLKTSFKSAYLEPMIKHIFRKTALYLISKTSQRPTPSKKFHKSTVSKLPIICLSNLFQNKINVVLKSFRRLAVPSSHPVSTVKFFQSSDGESSQISKAKQKSCLSATKIFKTEIHDQTQSTTDISIKKKKNSNVHILWQSGS